jgi:hypothetical protein
MDVLMNQRDTPEIDKRASKVIIKDVCNFPEDPNVVTVNSKNFF